LPIEQIYREEWGSIVAILIRSLSGSGPGSGTDNFALAEEAAQEAFTAALTQWPVHGTPPNPRAWLISTARNKAIDMLRRQSRYTGGEAAEAALESLTALDQPLAVDQEETSVEDDRLRLIFTCCHPSLATEAQVALTLRTLCGLSTEQIAHAFLVPMPTMAQRLVRAQQKIRDAGIPYRTPPRAELPARLNAVLLAVYLVFNQGYSQPAPELAEEAIYLGRLICQLIPAELMSDAHEPRGLLALMLLHHSRRAARTDPHGDLILLDQQDRDLWKRSEIEEGIALAKSALHPDAGPYAIQAAIAATHCEARTASETDWPQIVALYDVLLRLQPSPVIELNRAAAIAMAESSDAALEIIAALEAHGQLARYAPLHAARAALLWKEERWALSAAAYRTALSLASEDQEKRFLSARLAQAEQRSVP
jgi:RNA polymerase sigma-70 factor, ECF subfamily